MTHVAALCVVLAALLSGCSGNGDVLAPAHAASAGSGAVALARGVVELPGGLFELMPPHDGSVASVTVREGDTVRAGQPLLRLNADTQQHDQVLAQAERDVARARLQALQAKLPAARQQAQRFDAAVRADVLEVQRAEESRQALAELQSSITVGEAELALAQRKLQQVQTAASRLLLTAPMAAQVLRVQVQPGARVNVAAGRPLMVLMPQVALRVRAELNEAYAARVKPGMRARVLADGDLPPDAAGNAQAARVVRVSPMYGASRLDTEAQPRAQLRVLDCFLEFDGPAPVVLRAGQSVRVEFLP